jgi:predicted amidohydrolase YtcJ
MYSAPKPPVWQALGFLLAALNGAFCADVPDLVLFNGKIITVDPQFSIAQAVAIRGERIQAVGSDSELQELRAQSKKSVDLKGKCVVPGLIDSHVHPEAAMTEFDHSIPEMETVGDVLNYVRERAKVLDPGKWIEVRQVFITRLREQRYPTRQELDAAAPQHPVIFATGPDASLNSLALQISGIDKNFKITDGGSGFVEKDPKTGELTGILRNCTRFVKIQSSERKPTKEQTYQRTLELFRDYNSVGLTTVCDRDADSDWIGVYKTLRERNELPVRVRLSHHLDSIGDSSEIPKRVRAIAENPLRKEDPMLQIIGIKTFLDGGMLTGSAYMREPWGISSIYSITDPTYRGVLFIPRERLIEMVDAVTTAGLQFTAHTVGDGAVHALINAYEEVGKRHDIRQTRPCITHCNFMSAEAIQIMARLSISADIQPAWLYLDTRTLMKQFGNDRLRYFQPLHTLFAAGVTAGGGSDHMQKIGSMRSINPYNPFLGMAIAVTRKARWFDGALHPEERLSREEALKFYTINNAYLLFMEKKVGSIEPGKYADLAVLDRDLLTCAEEALSQTKVLRTYLAGKLVYGAEE